MSGTQDLLATNDPVKPYLEIFLFHTKSCLNSFCSSAHELLRSFSHLSSKCDIMSDDMSLPALFEATRLDGRTPPNRQPSSPQRIPFLNLPAELRIRIYREAIKLPNTRQRWHEVPILNMPPTVPSSTKRFTHPSHHR
ncbi:hypothetical protein HBI88_107540 [Parastagonospora nodorum]|nr:hypothetical protein HBI21_035830 [Parastagonospora nodorum]KAH5779892.1 hypothetical protein HBI97_117140 [Parastagonospora nodorum]KAH5805399.1 hypothetical protein HBI96_118840 [Parastagonospora nodorum]KAH5820234.1 hypothetical protein HBI94_101820 [Parastagonospora nodorum]KAH5833250.1 hypothetical protein HBI93_114280 [Parastagonospora nodorum]